MKRALLIISGTVGGLGAVMSITPPQLGIASNGPVSALAAGSNALGSAQTASLSQAGTTSPTPTASTPTPKATKNATASLTTKSPAPVKAVPTSSKTSPTTASTPAPTSSQSPSPTAAQTPTPKATQTPSSTPTQTPTQTPTPTPTPTKTSAPTPASVSGTFSGASFDANQSGRIWGRVTVTVTLNNGAISNISAVQSPSSRSYNAFATLTPAIVGVMAVKDVMAISPNSLFSQVQGRTGASYTAMAYWESLQSALSKAGL